MNQKRNSMTRVILILLAVAAVVLAVIQIVRSNGTETEETTPQADLSGYGELTGGDSTQDDIFYEDDSTLEMDSIPNDALVSGGEVSGTDMPVEGEVPVE